MRRTAIRHSICQTLEIRISISSVASGEYDFGYSDTGELKMRPDADVFVPRCSSQHQSRQVDRVLDYLAPNAGQVLAPSGIAEVNDPLDPRVVEKLRADSTSIIQCSRRGDLREPRVSESLPTETHIQ